MVRVSFKDGIPLDDLSANGRVLTHQFPFGWIQLPIFAQDVITDANLANIVEQCPPF